MDTMSCSMQLHWTLHKMAAQIKASLNLKTIQQQQLLKSKLRQQHVAAGRAFCCHIYSTQLTMSLILAQVQLPCSAAAAALREGCTFPYDVTCGCLPSAGFPRAPDTPPHPRQTPANAMIDLCRSVHKLAHY